MEDLAEQLIDEEEGAPSAVVYKDIRGYDTIGRGVLVQAGIAGSGLSADELAFIDQRRVLEARHIAAGYPNFVNLSAVRQAVLVSVSFQLGLAPLHWPDFMACAARGDYAAMATAGLNSLWATKQTPKRAQREMSMLSTDTWIPHGG
jgi:GH24 family phage-related lysozyme (muramidase)